MKDAKMAVKYQASTVTNFECDNSKIDYKQPFLDGSKLRNSVHALRNNPIRVATLCLALLCALLLAGLIGQSVHHQKVEQDQQNKLTTMSKAKEDLQDQLKVEQRQKRDLETIRNDLEMTNNYFLRRKDQLQTNNNLLTEEKKQLQLSQSQLQASHDGLNKEVEQLKASIDQLQTTKNALFKDKDLLQMQFDLVLKRKNELHVSYDSVTKERDNLQDVFHNVSRTKGELRTSYMKLIEEVEHLQERHNFTAYEKDEAASSHQNLLDEVLKLKEECDTLKIQEDLLTQKFGKAMSNYTEFKCNNQTKERERLQKMNEELTEERSLLQIGVDSLNATLDKTACKMGWRKFESSCFFTSVVKKTWTLAREYCQNNGAELAIITSQKEMRFVNGLYRSDQEVWIGLTDKGVEGKWEWVDGTPMTTTFWGKGQPNSHSGRNQDCVEFWHRALGVGEWNDENCKILQYFICEI
ncbi:CD209 antigen-like [Labrus mixtus]|uniref:CD209 antigen-like n=1 Tax=Labrus mixtus TaxID=508554 RepID=UPI0029BFED8F|nr:CD209 antigen-like [Labrus mixtus]